MNTKDLKLALDAAIMGYIHKFEKAHGVGFDYAVGEDEDLTGVLCFGDHYFNMSDIVYDVDNKLPIRLIFEWQDAGLDAHSSGNDKIINLKSYAMGLRYERESKQLEFYINKLVNCNNL